MPRGLGGNSSIRQSEPPSRRRILRARRLARWARLSNWLSYRSPWHSRQRKRGPPYRMRHWRWHPGHLNHCLVPRATFLSTGSRCLRRPLSAEPSVAGCLIGQTKASDASSDRSPTLSSRRRATKLSCRTSRLQKATTSKDGDVQRQVTFSRPALISLPSPGAKATHVASLFFSKSFGKLGRGH